MRAFAYWLTCMLLLVGLSCSQQSEQENAVSQQPDGPLLLEQWREYPSPEKYEPAVLDRLRMHDEKLVKSRRAWDKYFRQNVMPEMEKDFPRNSSGTQQQP